MAILNELIKEIEMLTEGLTVNQESWHGLNVAAFATCDYLDTYPSADGKRVESRCMSMDGTCAAKRTSSDACPCAREEDLA